MQEPFGIASDLHFNRWSTFAGVDEEGINTRLNHILSALREGCARVAANKGHVVYLAGDLFHVRGSIAPSVLNPVLDCFREIIDDFGIAFRIIPGNHDLESNDSRRLTNACQALESLGCDVNTEPVFYADHSLYMIPWMPHLDDVRRALREGRAKHDARRAIIHAPINGVLYGIPDHGLDAAELDKYGYERIFAGHYHDHRDLGSSVTSIGALTHQTWSDVGTRAGFLVVDEHGVHRQWESDAPRFIDYDLDWDEADAEMNCDGNFVRVKLGAAAESEIQTVRQSILDAGALGCVVQATPQAAAVTRTGATVSSGARIEQSIEDWIKGAALGVDEGEVYKESLDVLAQIEEV